MLVEMPGPGSFYRTWFKPRVAPRGPGKFTVTWLGREHGPYPSLEEAHRAARRLLPDWD